MTPGERLYRLAEAEGRAPRTRWAKYFGLLRAAAAHGHVQAQTKLGMWYLQGFNGRNGKRILRRSPRAARRLFEVAAKAGDVNAFANLAYCFDAAVGGPRSEKDAIYWNRRAIAHGSIIAAYNMSTIYRDRGDRAGRIRWLRRAISMGDTEALVELGRIVLFGNERQATKAKLARKLRRLAESTDEQRVEAMLLLADAYEHGASVVPSETRASTWRSRALHAEVGSPPKPNHRSQQRSSSKRR